VRRLVALVPPPNTHLTSFHGVFASHAALRPTVTLRPSETTPSPKRKTKPRKPTRRLDWAALHQHTLFRSQRRRPQGLCPAPTSCAAPAAADVAFTPSTPPGRPPRSASSSSATTSRLVASSRPPLPSRRSPSPADAHPLECRAHGARCTRLSSAAPAASQGPRGTRRLTP
jgi:hypothetical protein